MPMDERLTRLMQSATSGGDFVSGKKAQAAELPAVEGEDDDLSLIDGTEADPVDAGELTDDVVPETEDDGTSGDESDEEPDEQQAEIEETDEEGDESEGDTTEEESGASDEDEEDEPEDGPTAADPVVLELQRQNYLLMQALAGKQQQERQPPAPAPEPEVDVPDEVVRAVMYGAGEEVLKNLPPHQREAAFKIAQREASDRVRYAKNPNLFYQERVAPLVVPEVLRMLQPLVDSYQEQQTDRLIKTHLEPIKDSKLRQRAVALFAETPGSRSPSWAERERALALAVKAARGEAAEMARGNDKQKRVAQKAQSQAAGGKKLKAAPKARGSGNKAGLKIPDMKPNESADAYYARIKPLFDNQ